MNLLIVIAALFIIYIIATQIRANKKCKEVIKRQQQTIEEQNDKLKELEKRQFETIEKCDLDQIETESYEEMRARFREANKQQIEAIMQRNNDAEERRKAEQAEMIELLKNSMETKKKPSIPWFAVGTALSKAKNAQTELRKEKRELKKAIDKINKMK